MSSQRFFAIVVASPEQGQGRGTSVAIKEQQFIKFYRSSPILSNSVTDRQYIWCFF